MTKKYLPSVDDEEMGPLAKGCSCVVSVVMFGLFCTVTAYLGIFAYRNPDPKACWVVRDLHTATTT